MAASPLVKATVRVSGVVQGVGFRPFVARLAMENQLTGSVRNAAGDAILELFGPQNTITHFLTLLEAQKPTPCVIHRLEKQIDFFPASIPPVFSILQSDMSGGEIEISMPTPDLAVCQHCLQELDTPGNPRFRNPFISCTHCGPRFSILNRLPYDRPHTAMLPFPLCSFCTRQYTSPEDRRYHAQTICCNECGPFLTYQNRSAHFEKEAALSAAVTALNSGKIVAIKGIGGYHFACSPFDEAAVLRLRKLKGREQKPFAVMFENPASLHAFCDCSAAEAALLATPARPIVLLRRKPSLIAKSVFAASPDLGAFLPYTPLQHLILRQTGPLLMTSANISSRPIIYTDDEIFSFWHSHEELSGVLSHNRAILRPLDDSVAALFCTRPTFLRRSRGYVPLAIPTHTAGPPLLACGAQEKSTICFAQNGYAYPSAEIGDLDNLTIEAAYHQTVQDMRQLLAIRPALLIHDMHPGYASTKYAFAQGLPTLSVQHHHAHIASVMAEHHLSQPVIGVAFDGTGYGTDGSIWGGEFLIATPTDFRRAGHLKPVAMLGGDLSIRQGWKSAACLLWDAGLSPREDPRFPIVHAALANGINTYLSSSMGRVFDAVSAILGICEESHYGGQGAIALEYAASDYLQRGGEAELSPLPFDLTDEEGRVIIHLAPAIRALYKLHRQGESSALLAWRFHITVCALIVEACMRIARQSGIRSVVLSGGVFANRLLTERTIPLLEREGFTVYQNHQVPPGDGGISLGQAYIGLHTGIKKEVAAPCALQFPAN